jgi:mono/diheme cytochrome c family protein
MHSTVVRVLAIGVLAIGAATIANGQQSGPAPQDVGKHEYDTHCAICHGVSGKGDGLYAVLLRKSPADLTILQKDNKGVFPFDQVYNVIDGREAVAAHGPRDMPVWGDIYTVEAVGRYPEFGTSSEMESFVRGRIVALIGYISSLQAK